MSVRTAGFVFVALLLAGCAGRSNGFAPASAKAPEASSRHVEPAHDLGRRAPLKTASVVVLLKYRDQAGLDRFVAQLATSKRPRYLTRDEFAARYAPTRAQEQSVVGALRRAGFTVDRRYANRTIIDASAPFVRSNDSLARRFTIFAKLATAYALPTSSPSSFRAASRR